MSLLWAITRDTIVLIYYYYLYLNTKLLAEEGIQKSVAQNKITVTQSTPLAC